MKKSCTVSGKEFEITDDDLKFYEKMGVSAPTLCPDERQRRRISFRNFRNFYHRKCDATGKKIISMYSPENKFPIYENSYWWSDKWDGYSYEMDFDFSRSFFEQYKELSEKVPRIDTVKVNCENSIYTNFAFHSKNCYLVFGCIKNEDCCYGNIVWHSKNCIDCLYVYRCELCSNSVDLVDCYDVHCSTESANCSESYFLHDCRNCKNCFGCTNLRNAQYCFQNEQLTKDEYFEKLKHIFPLSYSIFEQGRLWMEDKKKKKCFFPELFGLKNERVSGNHIYESKNIFHGFDVKGSEDSKFLYTVGFAEDCMDISFSGAEKMKYCYDCLTLVGTENLVGCHSIQNSNNIAHSEFCYYSHDLLGCTGLKKAQYCILNKQYSKDEYFVLREKIVQHMKETGEWGEFFPIELSPFGYNETMAQEYFQLTKEECLARGWKWKDEEKTIKYSGPKYEIPNTIEEVSEDILKKILECETCKKNYRLVKPELEFYRKMKLPIPRNCPNCRHKARMVLRNPRILFSHRCDKCQKNIKTTFASNRLEIVYCEECYLKTIN